MAKRFVTRQKNCYCHTCARDIHYLGINSHRAAHRRRFEDCKITFTYGDTYTFAFSKGRPTKRAVDLRESAASQAESQPELNLVGGADTTPPANH